MGMCTVSGRRSAHKRSEVLYEAAIPERIEAPGDLAEMEHRERIEKLREKYRRMKEEKEEGNAAV